MILMRISALLLFLIFCHTAQAQKYISKSSTIDFFSSAPLEDIQAVNQHATSILDLGTNEIVFSVPIRNFEFQKSLMKKHFNENYMESDKYPKATFRGKIIGLEQLEGIYRARAVGKLAIHGKTKEVDITGEVHKKADEIILTTKFQVLLKDYNIKIPKILFSNIAESVEVSVEFKYKPYESN